MPTQTVSHIHAGVWSSWLIIFKAISQEEALPMGRGGGMDCRILLLLIKGLPWGLACGGGMQLILHSTSEAKPGRTQALKWSPGEPTQRWSPCSWEPRGAPKRNAGGSGWCLAQVGPGYLCLCLPPCVRAASQLTSHSTSLFSIPLSPRVLGYFSL